MGSTNKTPNIGLNSWADSDYPKREDFNSDNTKVDAEIKALKDGKVDKISGKGLSTNDYTTTEKTKLADIAIATTAEATAGINNAKHMTPLRTKEAIDNNPNVKGIQAAANAAEANAKAHTNAVAGELNGLIDSKSAAATTSANNYTNGKILNSVIWDDARERFYRYDSSSTSVPIGGMVYYGTTAPSFPRLNDLWISGTGTNVVSSVYNGSTWLEVVGSGGTSGVSVTLNSFNPTSSTAGVKGSLWINTLADTMFYKYSDGTGGWYQIKAQQQTIDLTPYQQKVQMFVQQVNGMPSGRYQGDLAFDRNTKTLYVYDAGWKTIT